MENISEWPLGESRWGSPYWIPAFARMTGFWGMFLRQEITLKAGGNKASALLRAIDKAEAEL